MAKEDGKIKFCDGIVLDERGAKKILSCVEIDEIIAIGSREKAREKVSGTNVVIEACVIFPEYRLFFNTSRASFASCHSRCNLAIFFASSLA